MLFLLAFKNPHRIKRQYVAPVFIVGDNATVGGALRIRGYTCVDIMDLDLDWNEK